MAQATKTYPVLIIHYTSYIVHQKTGGFVIMDVANKWEDYEIIDMADGEKLERWGDVILIRPDPQIIWKERTFPNRWNEAHAEYIRSTSGGGSWKYNKKIPSNWQIAYSVGAARSAQNANKNLTFNIKPMGFKHTGLFPEQAVNWDWMIDKIRNNVGAGFHARPNVLNLFAYTGGTSAACLYAGASVCHVDSSKGMTAWAKENMTASNLSERPIRYIVDDVVKFVSREIRRGSKYDAIIMDPPSYGRGASGEVWQFEDNISDLVKLCTNLLSDNPLFFLINSYTTGISGEVLADILKINLKKYKGTISAGEVGLPMSNSDLILPCGIYGKWET